MPRGSPECDHKCPRTRRGIVMHPCNSLASFGEPQENNFHWALTASFSEPSANLRASLRQILFATITSYNTRATTQRLLRLQTVTNP